MDNAIDALIQPDLRAVHELEEAVGVPKNKRAVVIKPGHEQASPKSPNAKKPVPKK